jgi:hypothetical protein
VWATVGASGGQVAQYREIGKSEFLRLKDTGHPKSRNPDRIGTVPLEGRVATIGVIGKVPTGKRPSEFGSSGYRGSR